MYLAELIEKQPLLPFIRQSNFAVRSPWSTAERRLLDYLIVYIQEGECVFHIDGEAYEFGSGEFCLIQPNSVTTLEGRTNSITPFAHFDMFYHPQREESFPTRAGQLDLSAHLHLMQPRLNDLQGVHVPVRLAPKRPVQLRDTFLDMVESWQHRETLPQLKAQTLAMELVLTILEDHTAPGAASASHAPQSLNWITSFFSFHLSEPLSIEEMARRANLSPSRFSAVFKRQFGVPPHRYLLDLRIRHAEELLETTALPLEEIASYCGFADIHHFSKSFKRKTGVSPGMYRHMKRPHS
ncbi:helix-turn-helix domain-containing protein [Paenibacillus allorhizosphaerae]|uniref:HTH-type transcriptional activator RhaR n=1 Tax=Paenibacillus allorhizosphaerae TaxID=2849866 RepID=A0ABM8VHZ5_9BACL|nr:AraC family transcriptional regulator [Paenibacillus allorhizosphaerae]CAG7643324.1 HTH-type transcriptional activator RhaR [Paenibacillus allorhizosphaerae]